MATTVCANCGARNLDSEDQCRKCGVPLGTAPTTASRANAPGTVLNGKWVIDRPLPGSDDPFLLLGHHVDTGDEVILKRLTSAAARDRTLRSQFLREAELLAGLDHPNLVHVVDVVDDPAAPAFVMETVGGETLGELLILRQHIPVYIALRIAHQILDGLEYLHDARIVHRKLMPTKVFIGPDDEDGLPRTTIGGFALAHLERIKTLDELEQGTQTVVGMKATDSLALANPLPYQAPEQFGGASDGRADLYSFGAILFELITGEVPITLPAVDRPRAEQLIKDKPPTKIRQLRPEISANLEALVDRLLRKDPAGRYASVAEVRAALDRCPEARRQEMVPVAAGDFVRGSADDHPDGRPEERPQRTVWLDAFFIDRTPVTAGEYARYLDATGTEPPAQWWDFNDPSARPNHPVVYVNYDDATGYATWVGKRLPTEAQWEKAARYTDGRTYPWGEEAPTDKRAWFGNHDGPDDVGNRPFGASAWGALDMAGNAFEWTADWYDRDYYASAPDRNPPGPQTGDKRVIRGGSFSHDRFALRCAARGRYEPDARRANHGFRCVWALD